ncbi:hypothetical protein GGR56DRAFT_538859 [Xylariaceae sp. FL0804]|nr:hypothetical protein GGR56DRAFT_538859 [Xylariaceae sp. FL0804]
MEMGSSRALSAAAATATATATPTATAGAAAAAPSKLQNNIPDQNTTARRSSQPVDNRSSSTAPASACPPSSRSLSSARAANYRTPRPVRKGGPRTATVIASHAPAASTPTSTSASTSLPPSSFSKSHAPPLNRRILQPKNQNVASALRPLLKRPPGKMPYDSNSSANGLRPHLPVQRTTTARVANRPPLTPKIASHNRRTPRPASVVAPAGPAATTPSGRDSHSRRSSLHEDTSAVLTPHLPTNVTPRSGSRQSRVDSANSTPNGTPNAERIEPGFSFSTTPQEADSTRRTLVTFGGVNPDSRYYGRQEVQQQPESKFFHASEVKNARPLGLSKPAPPRPTLSKAPTFFYANGSTVETKHDDPAALRPVLGATTSQDSLSSRFLYANGAPELRPGPPSRGPGSVTSSTSRPASAHPVTSHPLAQRPVSPVKTSSQPQPSLNTNFPSVSGVRPQMPSPPPLRPSPPELRRSSIGTSRSGGHSRSSSLSNPMASPASELFPAAQIAPRPAPLSLASILQAAEEFGENEEENEEPSSPDESRSALHSPTKSTHSTFEPISELVANARRERKVQDLQIRNASLEAINRTLERQLRKQSAELRRFRRLSRAGRLSLASTTPASRVTSAALSEQQSLGLGLSELGEEDSEWNSEDELGDDSFSDTDSLPSSASPRDIEERDAKHRLRDEQRLQLDLSKHQELLKDSQKINQSIKRCLDFTDELINEGKKALNYNVRVSDVKLGGRVLDPLDEEDDTLTINAKPSAEDPERLSAWGPEPQDRDSGIELPEDGG